MRHRLDKNGKRYGKVIDYKVSELRVAELLDTLCEDMEHYTWARQGGEGAGQPGAWAWALAASKGGAPVPAHLRAPPAELKVRKRELKSYCYAVVERAEEALASYLSSGQAHHEGLDEFICEQLVPHCPKSPGEGPADGVHVDL